MEEKQKFYLALDLGGTKTTVALFSTNGKLINNSIITEPSVTFQGEERVYSHTLEIIRKAMKNNDIIENDLLGIGVGAPGPLDTKAGTIIHAPLMGWHDFPIALRLSRDLNVEVRLDNDGNLGALAEQRNGMAKGHENVGYMTVSTGIGGGLVFNGKIYHGKNDGAGEFGHISIFPDGLECPCGNRGCLELYASGTAIARIASEEGISFNAKQLAVMADDKNETALKIFKDTGRYLGYGITTIFNMLDLDILVLGGSVSKANKHFKEEMYNVVEHSTLQSFDRSRITFSNMSDHVVLYGAYHLFVN